MKWFFLLIVCFIHSQLFAKVRILTFHYNHADFVELQYKTLKKFLLDDFELIVFNDAKTEENERAIEEMCRDYDIPYVRFQQECHLTSPLNDYLRMISSDPDTDPHWDWNRSTADAEFANHASVRHSNVIQYALDHYGYDHDDIVVLMDGDHFIINYLSIKELLGSYDLVALDQCGGVPAENRNRSQVTVTPGKEMPWVVFIAFHPRKIPDVRELQFHVDVVSDEWFCPSKKIEDTGAAFYRYRKKHPNLKIQTFVWQDCAGMREIVREGRVVSPLVQRLMEDIRPYSVQFYLLEHCLHFSASSFNGPGQQLKAFQLNRFVNDLILNGP